MNACTCYLLTFTTGMLRAMQMYRLVTEWSGDIPNILFKVEDEQAEI
jgi:hypothetical protein